jgi:hypothetical protein
VSVNNFLREAEKDLYKDAFNLWKHDEMSFVFPGDRINDQARIPCGEQGNLLFRDDAATPARREGARKVLLFRKKTFTPAIMVDSSG